MTAHQATICFCFGFLS